MHFCSGYCFCSQLFRSGSWAFLVFLYLTAINLPQLCMNALIFSLLQFLCVLLLEESLYCKHCSKGSRSQVPACLKTGELSDGMGTQRGLGRSGAFLLVRHVVFVSLIFPSNASPEWPFYSFGQIHCSWPPNEGIELLLLSVLGLISVLSMS